jgi:hypothetical protein
LDTGCGNDSSNNTAIKHEVKEELFVEENHVHCENNDEQRFVLISCNVQDVYLKSV